MGRKNNTGNSDARVENISATTLQQKLILAVQSEFPKSRVWRNNCGLAIPIGSTHLVKFGVPGSGDLAGWVHINGRAIVLHIEVKAGRDRQRDKQKIFERVLTAHGGIYLLAHSVEQCIADLRKAVASVNL